MILHGVADSDQLSGAFEDTGYPLGRSVSLKEQALEGSLLRI
jgi:hypothetical protein